MSLLKSGTTIWAPSITKRAAACAPIRFEARCYLCLWNETSPV
jgi:hypothetical protein